MVMNVATDPSNMREPVTLSATEIIDLYLTVVAGVSQNIICASR